MATKHNFCKEKVSSGCCVLQHMYMSCALMSWLVRDRNTQKLTGLCGVFLCRVWDVGPLSTGPFSAFLHLSRHVLFKDCHSVSAFMAYSHTGKYNCSIVKLSSFMFCIFLDYHIVPQTAPICVCAVYHR